MQCRAVAKGRLWLKTEQIRYMDEPSRCGEAFLSVINLNFYPYEAIIFTGRLHFGLGCMADRACHKFIKDTFQLALAAELKLRRITAPIVVPSGKGLNDNLSGTEQPVSFGAVY